MLAASFKAWSRSTTNAVIWDPNMAAVLSLSAIAWRAVMCASWSYKQRIFFLECQTMGTSKKALTPTHLLND